VLFRSLVLSGMLPESYTVDFDMRVPSSSGYAVEVRPDVPNSPPGYAALARRSQNPVVVCGAIGAGVYGADRSVVRRFEDRLAEALVPCEIAVTPKGVKVYFAGQLAANAPGVSLGRGRRLRLYVPTNRGGDALIGAIRVATDGGSEGVAAAANAAPMGVAPASAVAAEVPVAPPSVRPAADSVRPAVEATAQGVMSDVKNGTPPATSLRGLGNRLRKRAEARATERVDSASSKAEQTIGAGADKALDNAANLADKTLNAADRVIDCLVSDLQCIRRARSSGAKIAVNDSTGRRVSSADSARAIARATTQAANGSKP